MTTVTNFSYGTVFQNIKPEVITATKELIKGGIWKADVSNEDKAILMGLWVQKVSSIYNIPAPKIYFIGGKEGAREYKRTGGGCYFPTLNEMYVFKKPSLTTLLHEFRHCMQKQLKVKQFRKDKEEDARAWSCSLYRLSAPNSYKKARENGLMHYS